MLRALSVVSVAILLAGCAQYQHHPVYMAPHKAPIVKVQPTVEPTPNVVVKKRWYDRFKKHPKFFH